MCYTVAYPSSNGYELGYMLNETNAKTNLEKNLLTKLQNIHFCFQRQRSKLVITSDIHV